MPRSPDQNARLREESRARILDAALTLFARRGYDATPVRTIATEAGVSHGLLYNHFRSKEEMLRAIFEQTMAEVDASLAGAEAASGPTGAVAELVRSALETVARHPAFWRLTYQLRMQEDVTAGLGDLVSAWSEAIRGRIEGMLRSAGAPDPALEARALFAAIDGAAQHYVLDMEGYPAAAVAETIIRRFTADR